MSSVPTEVTKPTATSSSSISGYDIANQYLGMHEVRDKKTLMSFFKAQGQDIYIDPSTTPWCAAFVNACERSAGKKGNGKVNARSFLTYGENIPFKDAKKGDIVVFARGNSTWQGHVAYFMEYVTMQGQEGIRTLGGNQGDRVSISWYPKSKLLGVRRYE